MYLKTSFRFNSSPSWPLIDYQILYIYIYTYIYIYVHGGEKFLNVRSIKDGRGEEGIFPRSIYEGKEEEGDSCHEDRFDI